MAKAVFLKALEHAIVPDTTFISAMGYYPSLMDMFFHIYYVLPILLLDKEPLGPTKTHLLCDKAADIQVHWYLSLAHYFFKKIKGVFIMIQ